MKSLTYKIKLDRLLLLSRYVIGCLTLCFSTLIFADINQATARELRASGQILPLEKIHAKAKKIKIGKILETELESKNGIYIYEVDLLDSEGIVWEVKLNAKTGQLIKLEED